jgi:phosphotriesterase-related protein
MAKELLSASERSGVHIIASTGFHKLDFYDKNHFVFQSEESLLTELFFDELTKGMYTDRVNGKELPEVMGTAKAGIIKCASDGRDIRSPEGKLPVYKKLFTAAGKAARAAKAPIMTHLEMGRGADSQLEILTAQGIAPNRIIMSHLDRVIGAKIKDYQYQTAKSGVYLQFDTIGRLKYHTDEEEIRFIALLCEKGFEDRILIGLDTTKERMKSYGGSIGLDYILDNFSRLLKSYGIDDGLFYRFTVINPMQALSMEL